MITQPSQQTDPISPYFTASPYQEEPASSQANVVAPTIQFKPLLNTQQKQISYISIESDGNYFNTSEQIKRKQLVSEGYSSDASDSPRKIFSHSIFRDITAASQISGSTSAAGFFAQSNSAKKPEAVSEAKLYPTSSYTIDASGNVRKLLASNIDFYVSSSVDKYKNGIEIQNDKDWTSGLAKITAGEPGHLVYRGRFGDPVTSLVDLDAFQEISPFNPVEYTRAGGVSLSWPIVSFDSRLDDKEISNLDGIIEPMPIRSVISNMTLFHPYEPHSTKGTFEGGNTGKFFDSEMILTVDYREIRNVREPFIDTATNVNLSNDNGSGVFVGPVLPAYFGYGRKTLRPWVDEVPTRGIMSSSMWNYTDDMKNALLSMLTSSTQHTYTNAGERYINEKQRSATTGFVYNDSRYGTDSIAFGGLAY